jgi:hypothetical protein
MPFLTDDDYDVQTRPELMQVIASSSVSRQQAELMAQATMTESLNKRFDTAAIFSATGDDRNIIVIMYMIDITLYILHSKTALRAMPAERKTRFDAAKEWLKLVRQGDINPDLPEPVPPVNDCDNDTTYLGSAGSNQKRYLDW